MPKFIMAARFVPGLRAVTYFVAGLTGVPYWKFITFDGIAACVSAPAWVYLGWSARKHGRKMLEKVWAWSAQTQIAMFAVIVGITVLYILFVALRRRSRRRRGQPDTQPPIPLQRGRELERPASGRRS